ncbi:Major Facilitator Superfamily [Popillia japonica]|uniref:Major Facilitator Superfamily n=1 Tax=Popillia japonica TaxID=7064 RepID=A0AAW1JXU2_POPJA
MIHIVNDGVTYSFGVFYDEFLHYFDEGKGRTAWILSLLVGVTLCSGPISSSLVNKWGCRIVTIAGSILAGFCLFISFWANSVFVLYLTIGIGTGFGFGLIYLPAIVSVTMYFEKKRSLATGIAVCGSGFGTFIFAPIITVLLREYGWRGSLMIIAGIVLECTIFGALFRPLEYESTTEKNRSKIGNSEIHLKNTSAALDLHISDVNLKHLGSESTNMHRPRSMGHFATPRTTFAEPNGNIINGKLKNNKEVARLAASQPLLMTSMHHDAGRKYSSQSHLRGPIYKPDIFYQGSLMNIPSYRSKLSLRASGEDELLERRPPTRRYSKVSEPEEKTTICGIVCSPETKDTLREMLDFSLFKDVIFILFVVSNFLTSIGFNIPYVYIVSRARALDLTHNEASMLLSIIGVANTVGRIILGYISDKPWVNRLWVYNVCLTLCGVATALSAFCMNFFTLSIYASVFGFTIGAYVGLNVGLTSVILVDLLGLDKLTNAFGLLLLFQGIASFIGPPIGGELYDIFESFDPAFYLAGATIAASGLILFAIPSIQKYQSSKKSGKTQVDI